MHILVISDHNDPLAKIGSKEAGGQAVYVKSIAGLLASQGHQVDVYTRWDSRSKREVVQVAPNFRVIRVQAGPKAHIARDGVGKRTFFGVINEFTTAIQRRALQEPTPYDIIYTHYWMSGVAGSKLSQQLHIPLVHMYHSIGSVRRRAMALFQPEVTDEAFFTLRNSWERRIAKQADGLIATCPAERDNIVELLDADPAKVAVIPIGVDPELFHPYDQKLIRAKLGMQDAPSIVYAGRLQWSKGISVLLSAMQTLVKEWPALQLYIVGGEEVQPDKHIEDPELQKLWSSAKKNGLEKNVHFLGARPQSVLGQFYAAADVCAMPSYYESFGIVPLESMACGTPVVATRTGGMLLTVEEGTTGYLVTVKDQADLADKLAKVLRKGKEAYSRASRQRIIDHFAWDKIGKKIADQLADTIVAENGRRSDTFELGKHLELQHAATGHRKALFTDIDDTLVDSAGGTLAQAATSRLKAWSAAARVPLIVATGNPHEMVLERIRKNEVPEPQTIISSVGTAIWHRTIDGRWVPDEGYAKLVRATGYDRRQVAATARDLIRQHALDRPELALQFQPIEDGNFSDSLQPHKVSLQFIHTQKGAAELQQSFTVQFPKCKIVVCEEIHHNATLAPGSLYRKFCLDILALTKKDAVDYLVEKFNIGGGWKAGDSGNDAEMLISAQDHLIPIIVGGFKPELRLTLQRHLADERAGPLRKMLDGRTVYIETNEKRRGAQSILHATRLTELHSYPSAAIDS